MSFGSDHLLNCRPEDYFHPVCVYLIPHVIGQNGFILEQVQSFKRGRNLIDIGALLLAAVAGTMMAIQGALNALLGNKCGVLEASWVVHVLALGLLTMLLFIPGLGKGELRQALGAPWYTFFGGPLNVGIIYLVISSIPKLGMATATTAIITAQVITAAFVDHLGAFGAGRAVFTFSRIAGFLLLAGGTWLLLSE